MATPSATPLSTPCQCGHHCLCDVSSFVTDMICFLVLTTRGIAFLRLWPFDLCLLIALLMHGSSFAIETGMCSLLSLDVFDHVA